MSKTISKVCGLALVFCSVSGAAWAGNIFMKNGYIIQGPIVERSDGSIVLGWPNGKVTIHQRFIDSVVYDPNEERRLQEQESHSTSETPAEETLGLLGTAEEPDELPMDPDKLVQIYVKAPRGVENGTPTDPSGGPTDGSQGPEGTVASVQRPDELLADRFLEETLGFSFRPPKGWTLDKKADVFQAAGPAGADGFRPSLSVARVAKGPLSRVDFAAIVKEENGKRLEDFELLNEGPRTLGAHSAYELLGRGTRAGRVALVRQVLVDGTESLWLVSCFVPVKGGDSVAPVIDESLKTFELTAK